MDGRVGFDEVVVYDKGAKVTWFGVARHSPFWKGDGSKSLDRTSFGLKFEDLNLTLFVLLQMRILGLGALDYLECLARSCQMSVFKRLSKSSPVSINQNVDF